MRNDSNYNFYQQAKNEMDSWFFLNRTWPVPTILVSYITFLIVGTRLMKNRRPLNLKYLMIAFNVYQVCFNAYMFHLFLIPDHKYYIMKYACHPLNPAKNPLWLRAVHGSQVFFISKLTDLLDTVFIILRKKQEHLSFLHFYHHIGMVLYTWVAMNYFVGEQLLVIGMVNSFVHVIMYTYYILTLMGPSIRRYLWWKNYVTLLQMAQFALYIIYMASLIIYGCPQPKGITWFVMVQGYIFFWLFRNFYNEKFSKNSQMPVEQAIMKQHQM